MGEWIYNSSFDTVMDFAVTVDNVFKRYGQVEALQGVSLSVRPGELFGIIGPDGAGKTSLFRILATLLLADEGKGRVYARTLLSLSGSDGRGEPEFLRYGFSYYHRREL